MVVASLDSKKLKRCIVYLPFLCVIKLALVASFTVTQLSTSLAPSLASNHLLFKFVSLLVSLVSSLLVNLLGIPFSFAASTL